MTVRFRPALIAAAFLLLPPALASAQVWPSEVRRAYIDECLAGCTANTKYTSIQRAECVPYCQCMIKEAQSFMSAEDYKALQEATAAKKATPVRDRYETLSSICSQRVFR
jgi:hypothetical protein